jgi:hypothetical protein
MMDRSDIFVTAACVLASLAMLLIDRPGAK